MTPILIREIPSIFSLNAKGLEQTNSIAEAGIALFFSLENHLCICLDLQTLNKGVSATNAIEALYEFAQAWLVKRGVDKHHLRFIQIDSAGDVDNYSPDKGWSPFGIELKGRAAWPLRSVGMLRALLHDEFSAFMLRANQTLEPVGCCLNPSKTSFSFSKHGTF